MMAQILSKSVVVVAVVAVVALFSTTVSGDICAPGPQRIPCGFPGITAAQCHAKNCCFNTDAAREWCSAKPEACVTRAQTCNNHGDCMKGSGNVPDSCKCDGGYSGGQCQIAPPPNMTNIEVVHVINSCHLDIGFADSSAGIINRYFDHHIPYAVQVGQQLRSATRGRAVPDKLNFMFQSWVLSMYMDCPPSMGIHCPNPTQVAAFEAAVHAGDITWHAFPHNAELEMMDPSLIEAGLALTWAMDDHFGIAHKQTLSQRDVPGMTRSLIPLLTKAGVTAISIGANDGSTPPTVPKIFKWIDQMSNTSLLGMLNWPGYGSVSNGPVIVEGVKHALVYNWNGDNAGPFSAADYTTAFAKLGQQFPNAAIVSSTFDNFTQHVLPMLTSSVVPVLNEEMGDTWVYGCPSDPQKVARMRVINRAWRNQALTMPDGSMLKGLVNDPVLLNATRFALKLGEHTWGKDVKSNLKDNANWKNPDFYKAKKPPATTAPQYEVLEESWWEQREWGITYAVETLLEGNHPMAADLVQELQMLEPVVPTTSEFVTAEANTSYTCGGETIQFNNNGALTRLGSWVANDANPVLSLKYRQYSASDVASFFLQYCKSSASWVQHDYGKPGLPSDVPGLISTPSLMKLWKKGSAAGDCDFVAELSFDATASTNCGAPEKAWINISVIPGSATAPASADVVIGLFNKTQTRLPEAMFLQFQTAGNNGNWSANKLGEWVSSSDIVDGGTKHLHGVMEPGLRYSEGDKVFSISTMDAGVANFGNLTAYPSPVHTDADTTMFGSSFVLWDNLWGTNYIMWWPFEQPPPQQYSKSQKYFPAAWNDHMVSRYTMQWSSK